MEKKVIRLFQDGVPTGRIEVPAHDDYEMVFAGANRVGYVLKEKQKQLTNPKNPTSPMTHSKKGIIRRMEEVWRMWRLLCYVREHQTYLSSLRKGVGVMPHELDRVLWLTQQNRMERAGVASELGLQKSLKRKTGWEKGKTQEQIDKRAREELCEDMDAIQSVITSCIDNGYLDNDIKSDGFIFLTKKGKHFTDVFGLLKAWVKELGALRAIVIWLVSLVASAFAGANWDTITAFISRLP